VGGAELSLALSVFLACAVEAVEAFTIVLAVGTTRRWPPALAGVGAGALALAVLVAALGPALTALPLGVLRVVVGGLLLTFGLQWLRKAILRAAGAKDKHDEEAIFRAEEAEAAAAPIATGFDGYAFTISLKAVLLEGLEVAFIVLTFGANQHAVGLAAAAAALAIVAVLVAGLALRAPLARVPENGMKFAVGVLLTSFGIFWGAEGAGAEWPGGDAALGPLVAVILLAALAMVAEIRARPTPSVDACYPWGNKRRRWGWGRVTVLRRAGLAVWDFVVGDDWRLALAAVAAIGLTAAVCALGLNAWWLAPLVALAALRWSLRGARPHRDPRE